MRLLDTYTLQFHWVNNPADATYMILSHVWDKKGEQSFQDLQRIQADVPRDLKSGAGEGAVQPSTDKRDPEEPLDITSRRAEVRNNDQIPKTTQRDPVRREEASSTGAAVISPLCADERVSSKIRNFCAVARACGYRYGWMDSCCIDKTSSAELSEAINSMYEWYSRAQVCCVYLHDVGSEEDPRTPKSAFRRSEWFSRGWTLQELIAPFRLTFFSKEWQMLCSKAILVQELTEITGVDRDILLHHKSLDSVSVARRMSWAAERKTTRIEDEAYSLMGIFGIYMPTIYGEGRNAFIRLQEEIFQRSADQSIFAWGPTLPRDPQAYEMINTRDDVSLFAPDPTHFQASGSISTITFKHLGRRIGRKSLGIAEHTITNIGVRITLPLVPLPGSEGIEKDNHYRLLEAEHTGWWRETYHRSAVSDLYPLGAGVALFHGIITSVRIRTIYIDSPSPAFQRQTHFKNKDPTSMQPLPYAICLSPWTNRVLEQWGYTAQILKRDSPVEYHQVILLKPGPEPGPGVVIHIESESTHTNIELEGMKRYPGFKFSVDLLPPGCAATDSVVQDVSQALRWSWAYSLRASSAPYVLLQTRVNWPVALEVPGFGVIDLCLHESMVGAQLDESMRIWTLEIDLDTTAETNAPSSSRPSSQSGPQDRTGRTSLRRSDSSIAPTHRLQRSLRSVFRFPRSS
ncbi:hypothetical protein C8Q76DRAFT_410889 [Earliella scabrosa]|nr:hypothetical protein C8Q76DRAFT_410889 [Earliella scabrosa]